MIKEWKLSEICHSFQNGIGKGKSFYGSGTKVANIGDLYKSPVFKPRKYSLLEVSNNEIEKYKLEKGDLLFVRSSLKKEGVAYCSTFDSDEICLFSSFMIRARPNDEICDSKYLSYILRSPFGRIRLINASNTATITNISQSGLAAVEIPLPPLPEQQKIAAILDAADGYRQKTKQLIEQYDKLAQSLFIDMFGDPVLNPKGWEKDALKNGTTKIGSGATPRGGKEFYKEKGISLIRSLNVYDNRFKHRNLAFIDEEQAKKLDNVIVKEQDVLFNITGASICRSTIVPVEVLPARVNQHVSIIRPQKSKFNSYFICYLLVSKNVKRQLLGKGAGGGAVMEAITKNQLQNYSIIKPPLQLQNEFATRIKAIEAQKAQAEASLAKAETLFNCLIQKAFKGELTQS